MLIAIDNGHGLNTAGKRTPLFPDGSFIKEWEFNHATALKLKNILEKRGYDTLMVSDTTADTPLTTRAVRANAANADALVSVHYNALNGEWGSQNGVETFYYPGRPEAAKLAAAVQKALVRATGRRDRGVKTANFTVIAKTTMPSILVEAGFMDNRTEASVMTDPLFQMKVATAIADGFDEYFGTNKTVTVNILGRIEKLDGYFKDGVNYVKVGKNYLPIREVAESLGLEVGWDNVKKVVTLK